MLARRIKGKKIVLTHEESNEIESYTLLHLNPLEVRLLLQEANALQLEERVDGDLLYFQYKHNDTFDQLFKKFAQEHAANSPLFLDVTKKYESKVVGKSVLVRNPDTHIIKIAFRKDNNENGINRICIDDNRRIQFFKDCRKTSHFPVDGKFEMLKSDADYDYWSRYMNSRYVKDVYGKDI